MPQRYKFNQVRLKLEKHKFNQVAMSERFLCKRKNCWYSSTKFSILLNNVWNKHSLESGFMYVCGISACQSSYSNLQSFRRHVSKKHPWFFDKFMKVYKKNDRSNARQSEHSNSDKIEQYFAVDSRENTDYAFLYSSQLICMQYGICAAIAISQDQLHYLILQEQLPNLANSLSLHFYLNSLSFTPKIPSFHHSKIIEIWLPLDFFINQSTKTEVASYMSVGS